MNIDYISDLSHVIMLSRLGRKIFLFFLEIHTKIFRKKVL